MAERYELRRSRRKTLALEVTREGQVIVRAPLRVSAKQIERFVAAHADWIARAQARQRERLAAHPEPDEKRRAELIRRAKAELPPKVTHYARRMGVQPTGLTITPDSMELTQAQALEKLARRLERQSEFVLEGELYKRPKGDPGPLLAPWYNRKSISFARDENCEGLLFQPELADQVLEGFRFLKPYYDYMLSLAGDPAPEGRE